MNGSLFFLSLFGGVALLLWAARELRASIDAAFGPRLHRTLARAVDGRIRASIIGAGVAFALQSSSATGLVVASFAERGLIALAPALAVMLGADIGSSLAVPLLAIKSDILMHTLLFSGGVAALAGSSARWREIGRIFMNLALILLSLQLIVNASDPLTRSSLFSAFAAHLGGDPLFAFLIGAVLAWLMHSSVATILLTVSLASAGIVTPLLGLALVLGANAGSGLIPLGAALSSGNAARRVLLGNIAFRVIGAAIVLFTLTALPDAVEGYTGSPASLIIIAHIGFNFALAALFLPFLSSAAALLTRRICSDVQTDPESLTNLDDHDLKRPERALANIRRETMRLADAVELMLQESIRALKDGNENQHAQISRLENQVDHRQEQIKSYVARLMRAPLTPEEQSECLELLLFATNLEHVGDIIDHGLLKHAAKRLRNDVAFSDSGWREIQGFHARVVEQMRLSVNVFSTRDLALARELMAEKDQFRRIEQEAIETHFERLKAGTPATVETSDIHLDILRDLKRIAAHLTVAAHPILEANGALRTTRLKKDVTNDAVSPVS